MEIKLSDHDKIILLCSEHRFRYQFLLKEDCFNNSGYLEKIIVWFEETFFIKIVFVNHSDIHVSKIDYSDTCTAYIFTDIKKAILKAFELVKGKENT